MARTQKTVGPVEIDSIENATFERDGDELVIRVSLAKSTSKISESGKMRMFTSCRPFSSINDVPGCENMTVNLLVGRNMKFEKGAKKEIAPAAKKNSAKRVTKVEEVETDEDASSDDNDDNSDAMEVSNARRTKKPAAKKTSAKKTSAKKSNARESNRAERKRKM